MKPRPVDEPWRMFRCLARAAALLPAPMVDDSGGLERYQEYLQHGEAELACDELIALGDQNAVPRAFWEQVRAAACDMVGVAHQVEECDRRLASAVQPEGAARVACPCCGCLTLVARGCYEICAVCAWQDEQRSSGPPRVVWGGLNGVSLAVGRANYRAFGCCTRSDLACVRPPRPDELPPVPVHTEVSAGIARTAFGYFAAVFAVGFALGAVRTLWLAPWLGERWAQLVELPVMVLASWWCARWRVRGERSPAQRLAIGGIALAWLLAAEIALGMALRGLTLRQIVCERDPVAGPAYLAALLAFALLPWWCGRRMARSLSPQRRAP